MAGDSLQTQIEQTQRRIAQILGAARQPDASDENRVVLEQTAQKRRTAEADRACARR